MLSLLEYYREEGTNMLTKLTVLVTQDYLLLSEYQRYKEDIDKIIVSINELKLEVFEGSLFVSGEGKYELLVTLSCYFKIDIY